MGSTGSANYPESRNGCRLARPIRNLRMVEPELSHSKARPHDGHAQELNTYPVMSNDFGLFAREGASSQGGMSSAIVVDSLDVAATSRHQHDRSPAAYTWYRRASTHHPARPHRARRGVPHRGGRARQAVRMAVVRRRFVYRPVTSASRGRGCGRRDRPHGAPRARRVPPAREAHRDRGGRRGRHAPRSTETSLHCRRSCGSRRLPVSDRSPKAHAGWNQRHNPAPDGRLNPWLM